MARKNRRKAGRSSTGPLTPQALRDQAARLRDRDARNQLALADSLRTRFSISRTAHLPPVAVLDGSRSVSYPADGKGRLVGDDARHATGTITLDVDPWTPAAGDAALEETRGAAVGGWTADLVRDWLSEAMETLRTCPTDLPTGGRSSMPPVVREAAVSYGWAQARVRLLPTPAALGRLDVVLRWLFLLDDVNQRKAVVGVAMGLSLRRVARSIGRSHTHVAKLERDGVALLVAMLNG